jgi:DNA-binding transcriptional ArsR family regulator
MANASQIFNQAVDYPKGRSIFNQMVELHVHQLDSIFHALGDATRRRMLRELARGERTVGQLAEPFAISFQAASKHIKALEHAGLIRREVRGRTHVCRLDPGPLASAHQWLSFYERFWTEHLDVLERILREAAGKSPARKESPKKSRTSKKAFARKRGSK